MAAVVLDRTWITDVGTGVQLAVFTGPGWSDDPEVSGEVRRMAGGRFRAVSRAGTAQTLGFVVRRLSVADRDTLVGWAGRVLLVRDTQGRKLHGVFFRPKIKDYRDRGGFDVEVTLTGVTFTEAV